MDFETIERESLNLPVADRAKLAHELLESLDSLNPQEFDSLWLVEAERRAAELDSGVTKAIPADEVMRNARALIR